MSNSSLSARGLDLAGNDMAAIERAVAQAEQPRAIGRHHCHAVGCQVAVPPEMLMCKAHWFMVPHSIRRRVLVTYTPGQCKDTGRIKPAWVENARAAIAYVLQIELPVLASRLRLPEGYDAALAKVERVGMSAVAIRQEGKPLLVGSLATGEVREVPKPEQPAAANDAPVEPAQA